MSTPPEEPCQECNSRDWKLDTSKGEWACPDCGETKDEAAKSDEDSNKGSLRGEKSHHAEVRRGTSAGGTLNLNSKNYTKDSARLKVNPKIIRHLKRATRIGRKKQAPEILAEKKIVATIWEILGREQNELKEDSMDIFKKFWRGRGGRGRYSIDGVAVGCLFVAYYRRMDKSKPAIDVARFIEQTPQNKKRFEILIKRIRKETNVEIDEGTSDDFDPHEYLQHYIRRLELPRLHSETEKLKALTCKIYNAAKKRGFCDCRNPQDVLVASLYLAVKQNELDIEKKKIAEVTDRKERGNNLNYLPKEIEKLCGITI